MLEAGLRELARPGAAPVQPLGRILVAADDGQAEQVVQSAAVHADRDDLAALEQLVEALERRGGRLDILHLNEQPRDLLLRSGLAVRLRTCC